ncbi:MAG TPA: Na+/H+ antiporter NhaC [Chitinophagales bacterium]|nr:Na+/H+ antiporter NhaC [Chitinophagales bacterium]
MTKASTSHIPSIYKALIPVIFLISLLGINVILIYKDAAIDGSNQFILILSALVAAIVGYSEGFSWEQIENGVIKGISSTTPAILILLLIGALTGAWLLSGIVPAMIYYGLQIMHPSYFLVATCLICSLVSIAVGSSWSTVATVGIALLGVGKALGFYEPLIAGAIISGAYFGDKISPMSDTTNLASAMTDTPLFSHIKYMLYTTTPSYIITLIIFFAIGLNYSTQTQVTDIEVLLTQLKSIFNITPLLFIVPLIVIILIVKKMPAIPALMVGTLLGALFALIFQGNVIQLLSSGNGSSFYSNYKVIMDALTVSVQIPTENELLKSLLSSSGMSGMLNTVWLIISAMMFGGILEACNFLKSITLKILNLVKSETSLVSATVLSCISTNVLASDQYLSIVIPGRMFNEAYKEYGLASENLSRTLEDSGTVTSVLVPWNTCGAYQASVLGVATLSFAPFCFFNIISPIMTIIYSAFKIKIKRNYAAL